MYRLIERLLWFLAAAALVTYGLAAGETRLYQSYYNWKYGQVLMPPRARASGIPAAAAARETKAAEGQPLGRVEIPSINLSAVFLEGVETRTLRRGVGHIPGTALPGASGNVALSAHRDTFFRRLGRIRKNDLILLTSSGGAYQYVVESTQVVNPDEAIVLRDIGRPTLTLTTCYPFYYVGPAPQRFVVHAALVTDSP